MKIDIIFTLRYNDKGICYYSTEKGYFYKQHEGQKTERITEQEFLKAYSVNHK